MSAVEKPGVDTNACCPEQSGSEGPECYCELASVCRGQQNIVIPLTLGKNWLLRSPLSPGAIISVRERLGEQVWESCLVGDR